MKLLTSIVTVLLLFISGCTIGGQGKEVVPLYNGSNNAIDQTKSDEAKELLLSMEEVIEVKGVNVGEEIYVAVRVTQFDRLFLDRIRKEGHRKIKKRFPDSKVHVSTDKKVFMELEKLEKKISSKDITKTEIEKNVIKIEGFMKG